MFKLQSNVSLSSLHTNSANLQKISKKLHKNQFFENKNTSYLDETIDDILNGIECVQETKESNVKIEFNWLIEDIIKEINDKPPGEKLESEEFFYKKKHEDDGNDDDDEESDESRETENHNHDSYSSIIQNIIKSRSNKYSPRSCKCSSNNNKSEILNTVKLSDKLINELVCEYFIENSNWNLELSVDEYYGFNRSLNDSDNYKPINEYMSIYLNLIETNASLKRFYKNLNMFELSDLLGKLSKLSLKLKFYIFDSKFESIYKQKLIESEINLNDIYKLNKQLEYYTKKFGYEKFINLNEFYNWLSKKNSKNFSVVCDIKIYHHNESKLELKKSFKHVWTIKNWKIFLIENKIYNECAQQNEIYDDNDEFQENLISSKQLIILKSKEFQMKTLFKGHHDIESCNSNHHENVINNVLQQIKWKLQLYPNGYNYEYSRNLSLFLNFYDISKNLKDLIKLKSNSCLNIDELYFDTTVSTTPWSPYLKYNENTCEHLSNRCDDEVEMLVLIKPKIKNKELNTYSNLMSSQSPNSTSISTLNSKNSTQTSKITNEIFAKACFQISIVDDQGKKIDVCQTEKQLFELYGSWGYKEYLLLNDLLKIKEKYLKNNLKNLHLNCIIKLYYTLTTKRYLNNNNQNIINVKNKFNKKTKFYTELIQNFKYENLNNLKFDLSYLYKTSNMYDLIIEAPIELKDYRVVDTSASQKYKYFKVHKLILAVRSIVFERMFNQDHANNQSAFLTTNLQALNNKSIEIVKIVDFNAYIVNLFLKYLYTDVIEIDNNESSESESDNDDDDDDYGGSGNGDDELEKSVTSSCSSNSSSYNYTLSVDRKVKQDREQYRSSLTIYNDNLSVKASHCFNNKKAKYEFYTNIFMELFKISDKYCVYKLKSLCECKLITMINNSNLINLLVLSSIYNSTKLKNHCLNHLTNNIEAFNKNKKNFQYLEDNYPNLLAEILKILYLKETN